MLKGKCIPLTLPVIFILFLTIIFLAENNICGQDIYNTMTLKTSIRVSERTLSKLDDLKLTEHESYENIVIRLLNIYEPLLKGDSNVHENIKTNTSSTKKGER